MSHGPYRVGVQEHLLAASLDSLILDLTKQTLCSKSGSSWEDQGLGMALIRLCTLKVRTVTSIPGMSLTNLCSNTSTGIADIYACPFLLLIYHTEPSLVQTACLQSIVFLKEFCVFCYSDHNLQRHDIGMELHFSITDFLCDSFTL